MTRLLVYVIHYFDPQSKFNGKSKIQNSDIRREILENALSAYSQLDYDVVIKICGFGNKSLIPLDIDFSNILNDPQLILFEVLSNLHKNIDFDFVIVVEDDILVNSDSINNSIRFTYTNEINHIYHPHRLELSSKNIFNSIDLMLLPGKTGKYLKYNNNVLAEFMNPHAAFMLLSKNQVDFASKIVDLNFRQRFFGGYMASAFYNYLKPFILFRDQVPHYINYNIHLDPIIFQPTWKNSIKRYLIRLLENNICEYGKIFPPY